MSALAWFLIGAMVATLLGRRGRNLYRSVAFSDAADYVDACSYQVGGGLKNPERLALVAASLGLREWANKPHGGRENMPRVPAPPWDAADEVTEALVDRVVARAAKERP